MRLPLVIGREYELRIPRTHWTRGAGIQGQKCKVVIWNSNDFASIYANIEGVINAAYPGDLEIFNDNGMWYINQPEQGDTDGRNDQTDTRPV